VGFVSKGKASPKLATSEALLLDKTKTIITLEQVITGQNPKTNIIEMKTCSKNTIEGFANPNFYCFSGSDKEVLMKG